MTTDAQNAGPVTAAMVEAAARVMDPDVFRDRKHFISPFAGTEEQWRSSVRYRARSILEAAYRVRSAEDAEEIARLTRERDEARQELTHTHDDALETAAQIADGHSHERQAIAAEIRARKSVASVDRRASHGG